jgi:hypothetical protein
MNITDLKPNPKNPRKVSAKKLKQLERALAEFGDLSGIVFNRKTGQLVGGHQRTELFKKRKDAEVAILIKHKKPTKAGTVAEGYVTIDGERFAYREVSWDIGKEKAANIAANKAAGEWDDKLLTGWFQDLQDLNFDLDLTMFDADERIGFFGEDDPKPKKGKKENDGRVSSSAVKQFQLTFTEESAEEFTRLVEHFQVTMNLDSVSDTVLEVLRLAKDSAESE